MRRPSRAIWIDMPSPMPPKPSSMWWAMSLKFQVIGPPLLLGPLAAAIFFFGPDFFAAALCAGFLVAAFLAVFFAALRFAAFIPLSMPRAFQIAHV